jgi:maleylacetate reductase
MTEGGTGYGGTPHGSAGREFSYQSLPGRVVFGAGVARTRLAAETERLGVSRVLLITAGRAPLARELAAPLRDRLVGVFTGVQPHVPTEVAGAARQAAAGAGADALLSVGGGSATGTAKAVALTTGLPVIAVPTTYAGSEVTPVWGLTEDHAKTTGTDPKVLPAVVLYDPELTVSLPPGLSAASGLNAMAHAVEAFWAPGRNPVSSLAAAEAITALTRALPAVRQDGQDLAARSDLLYGAYLAAAAFAATGSGLHHQICHVLGGRYGLPHAQTHAIVLPHVLAFNAPGAPEAVARVAAAARAAGPARTAGPAGAGDPARALQDLAGRLGVPRGLRDLGLASNSLAEAAALAAPVVPADNPVAAGPDELRGLLTRAWAGEPARLADSSVRAAGPAETTPRPGPRVTG